MSTYRIGPEPDCGYDVGMPLSLWTVYDHPRDFPHCYVARRFVLDKPTGDYMTSADLEAIRKQLMHLGLTCMPRDPSDEPQIIETWI
jgi:hypothetical protein